MLTQTGRRCPHVGSEELFSECIQHSTYNHPVLHPSLPDLPLSLGYLGRVWHRGTGICGCSTGVIHTAAPELKITRFCWLSRPSVTWAVVGLGKLHGLAKPGTQALKGPQSPAVHGPWETA